MSKIMQTGNGASTASSLNNDGIIFLYDQPFKTGLSFIGNINPPYHLFFLGVIPMSLYVLCLKVIFPALRPRSKEAILSCNKWRFRHNVFMCLYSLASVLLTIRELIIAPDNEIGFISSFDVKAWKPMMCNKPTQLMYWVNGVFIVSKIVEWIDSAFIVWLKNDEARAVLKAQKERKQGTAAIANNKTDSSSRASTTNTDTGKKSVSNTKANQNSSSAEHELSFLHFYHHMTTLFAFILVLNCHGAVKMGVLLNGFVHFLMYWHYASPLPRVVVPFITLSQILQFFLVIYLWYVASIECGEFSKIVKEHPWEYRTPFLFTPVYLVFFVKYFAERWVLPLFGIKKKAE